MKESTSTAPAGTVAPGSSRRAHLPLPVRALRAGLWLLAALACGTAVAQAPALRGDPPEEVLVFESRPAGQAGGGIAVHSNSISGHTFRVTERTRVTRVGTQIHSFQPTTVYLALHRVATPVSVPDAVNETTLVGTSLLTLPGGGPFELSAPLDVTLEPGWYSIAVGTGRHGATAGDFNATISATGTPGTPQTHGPYTVRTDTNVLSLQSTTTRYFVYGYTLPPEPPVPTEFLHESVRPHAWWGSGGMPMSGANGATFMAIRFPVDRLTRLDRVSGWMGWGEGTVFAAIHRLPNANAMPPNPNSPGFESGAIATTLIETAHAWDEYGADFGGVMLEPGHYSLVIGTGRFGATGTASMITVADSIVDPGSLIFISAANRWVEDLYHYSMRLTGIKPEFTAGPGVIDFGQVPLTGTASRSITVSNLRNDAPLALTDFSISGDDAELFVIDEDAAACGEIATAASCSFTVHYHADAIGSHDALVEITTDAVPASVSVPLLGESVPSALITPSATGNGAIDPDSPQLVATGDVYTFTLTPAEGHHLASVEGSCGGSLDGLEFTTDPVVADCTVQANFAIDTFVVTPDASGEGSISPAAPQTIDWNQVAAFVLEPAPNHHIDSVTSSCGGALDGNVYTTAPVTADCFVHASFAIDTFIVTATAGPHGSISPAGVQTVAWNQTAAFTAIADEGYHVEEISGTCGGVLEGTVFTTAPVTADCTVHAAFALDAATTLNVVSGTDQQTVVDSAFAEPLVVRVSNDAGLPVPGVTVQFSAPGQGASASVPANAISDENGLATVAATANTIRGSYVILATAEGLAGDGTFALANLAAAPAMLEIVSGAGQSARVGTGFDAPLVVEVRDGFGNTVPAADVLFESPASGASAALSATSVTSGEDGRASVTATANAIPGNYVVTATTPGVAGPASFPLENTAPALQLSIGIDGRGGYIGYGALAEYVVTVGNDGTDAANAVAVLVPLPEQLDGAAAEWHCLDLASGCTAEGTGALDDLVDVPAGGAVRYVLTAPVRLDAAGDWIEIEAFAESTYHEPVSGIDRTWLVLLRDGFDETVDPASDAADLLDADR